MVCVPGEPFLLIVHPCFPWEWESVALRNCPDIERRLSGVLAKIREKVRRAPCVAICLGEPAPLEELPDCDVVFHSFSEHPRDVARRVTAGYGTPSQICGFWGDRCVMDIAKQFPAAEIIRGLSPKYPF